MNLKIYTLDKNIAEGENPIELLRNYTDHITAQGLPESYGYMVIQLKYSNGPNFAGSIACERASVVELRDALTEYLETYPEYIGGIEVGPSEEERDRQLYVKRIETRVKELEAAIREHASQRLDDRCYLDDLKLYKLIGIEEHPGLALPEEEFLSNCKRYWKCQQTGDHYES